MAKSIAMCFLLLAVLTSQVKGRSLGEISESHPQTSIKKPDCITTPSSPATPSTTTPSPGTSTPSTPSHGGTTTPSHGGTGTPSTPSHGGTGTPYHDPGTPSTPSHGGYYNNPPTPSHGGSHNNPPTPSHGGYYNNPPTPSHGGYYNNPPTPTPTTPSHGGGYYGNPPPLVPVISTPPSIPIVTPAPPLVPLSPFVPITPPTPFFPVIPTPPLTPVPFDPNIGIPPFFTGTCDYWRTHPNIIWGLLGYWGTMSGLFGPLATTPLGTNLNVIEALSNTRNDGIGSLFREGTTALLNSMVNPRFPFTTQQVRDSFLASVNSDNKAKKQANVFKKANEGRMKHN